MPAGLTMLGVPLSVMPMKPTGTPPTFLHRQRQQDRLAGVPGDIVRGEVGEVGADEAVAVLAAVYRVAAAVLQAQQLVDALVELVVADGGHVQAEQVERLDGRLVVEGGAQQRRGADHVAGADGQGLLARCFGFRAKLLEGRGEVLGTPPAGTPFTAAPLPRAGRAHRGSR